MRELEVKVLRVDLEKMEEKLKSLGARLIAREKQINTIIDSEDNYIEENLDSYLRIRETHSILNNEKKIRLTMKENIYRQSIRENIETNIDISDKKKMLDILEKLGYKVKSVGYKDRSSYELDGIRFDLDTWDENTYPEPYMEIEVKKEEELEKMIQLLGINKENISKKSILELRKEKGLE